MRFGTEMGFRQEIEKIAQAEGLEKLARLYPNCGNSIGSGHTEWSDQFKGTPFYKEALSIQKEEAKMDAVRARRRARDEAQYAEEATFRVKTADLEAKLAEWQYNNMDIGDKSKKAHVVGFVPEPDVPLEKIAGLRSMFGKALGGVKSFFGSRAGKATAAIGGAAAAGGAGYGLYRRKKRGESKRRKPSFGMASFSNMVPANVKNSKLFKMLVRRAQGRFPDVPKKKIEGLVYEAMKEKGVA